MARKMLCGLILMFLAFLPSSAIAAGSIVGWGEQVVGADLSAGFVAVAAGYYHSLGLRADGSIAAWGDNYSGQCNVPWPNSGFVAVAAGGGHSLGLRADGSIAAWGDNYYGQCNVPWPNSGFVAVAAGDWHSLGLRADGSIAAWGDNYYGQCNVPSPNSGFVAVAAGDWHSLGLRADGSIAAWGDNRYGQCNVPSPNSGFVAVAAGYRHSLGLRAGDGWRPATVLSFSPNPVTVGGTVTATVKTGRSPISVDLTFSVMSMCTPPIGLQPVEPGTWQASFGTSFLQSARGSSVQAIATLRFPGGQTETVGAVLMLQYPPKPPPPPGSSLSLFTDDTQAYGIAESWFEVTSEPWEVPLRANLFVKQDLNLWFEVRAYSTGKAIQNPPDPPEPANLPELMGSLGLAPPEGTVAWRGTFYDPYDSITMELTLSSPIAAIANVAQILMYLIPGGSSVKDRELVEILNDLRKIDAIRSAQNAFIPAPKGVWGWTKATAKAAWSLRRLASDKVQRNALRAVLLKVGLSVSDAQLKAIFQALSGYDLLKIIASEVTYIWQTGGDTLRSTFTAYKSGASGSLGSLSAIAPGTPVIKATSVGRPSQTGAMSAYPTVAATGADWAIAYTVTNSGSAPLWIWSVYFDPAAGPPIEVSSPPGWSSMVDPALGTVIWFTQGPEGWASGDFGESTIPVGGSLSGFGIRHVCPPGYTICNAQDTTYVQIAAETLAPGADTGLGVLKERCDALAKAASDKVVTAVFPDCYYVSDANRACGIRVTGTLVPTEGDIVRLVGEIQVIDGEAVLQASSELMVSSGDPPDALGMSPLHLGGGDLGIQTGVGGGFGLNNTGLLVRTWGKVTSTDGNGFVIEDGSNYLDPESDPPYSPVPIRTKVLCPEGVAPPEVGKYLVVTGISSCQPRPDGKLDRLLRPRRAGDIRVLDLQ